MENIWRAYEVVDEKGTFIDIDTRIEEEDFELVAKALTVLPSRNKYLRKILKLINDRKKDAV